MTEPDLLARAQAAPGDMTAAARILPLLDLTSLGDDDTDATIERLCQRALEAGVGAVCVYPRFVALARRKLVHTPIQLATVANFPEGGDDIAGTVTAIATAIAAGADEIDVVAPIQAVMEGDVGLVTELVQASKAACDGHLLKVILETGKLEDPARITAAARSAIMAGADFLKTSTGKFPVGATLEAAAVLLAVIEEADGRVGIKFAGGIRNTAQAASLLYLVDHFLGSGWTRPGTLRFGASSLLDDLLGVLR